LTSGEVPSVAIGRYGWTSTIAAILWPSRRVRPENRARRLAVLRKVHIMKPVPHGRTDKLFAKLKKTAKDGDTKAILEALHWLCILTEEVGFGVQIHSGEIASALTEVSDKLDSLAK